MIPVKMTKDTALKTLINDLPHGFRTTITSDVENAVDLLKIAAIIEDTDVRKGVIGEAMGKLLFSYKILSAALLDDNIDKIDQTKLSMSMVALTNLASYVEKDAVFIVGAVSDPFIHGVDEELRASAIMNLYKAMIMLKQRLQPYV